MWIDREKYTSHISDNETVIKMRKVLDKIEIVLRNHLLEKTDFLDPYERRMAKSILNRFNNIGYLEEGGYNNSERKIIIIFPYYFVQDKIRSNISLFKIEGKLGAVNHRDYLGALLSLGIKRDKIGDILVHDNFGFVITMSEISKYILYNFKKIGNKNIEINLIKKKDIILPELKFKEIKRFLASLRLDVVISGAYDLPRKKITSMIKSGNVKVNWEPINKPSTELKSKDMVSVKGYGRFLLNSIEGISKKGRLMCIIRIIT